MLGLLLVLELTDDEEEKQSGARSRSGSTWESIFSVCAAEMVYRRTGHEMNESRPWL